MDNLVHQFLTSGQAETESKFAVLFTRRSDISVRWDTDAETGYTDGTVITLNPAVFPWVTNQEFLAKICREEGLPARLCEPKTALATAVRALNLHECLHVIFTPLDRFKVILDSLSSPLLKRIFGIIFNILEDKYIEDKGAAIFPSIAPFLRFVNAGIKLSEQTGEPSQDDASLIINWLCERYIFLNAAEFPKVTDETLAEQIIPLADKGSSDDNGEERLRCAFEIMQLLAPLIPNDAGIMALLEQSLEKLEEILSASSVNGKGNNNGDKGNDELVHLPPQVKEEIQDMLDECSEQAKNSDEHSKIYGISDTPPTPDTTENKITTTDKGKNKATQFLIQNAVAIRRAAQGFAQLIFSEDRELEEKKSFGAVLDRKHLADVKKRRWCNPVYNQSAANLAVVVLMDRSYSMLTNVEKNDEAAATLICALEQSGIPFVAAYHHSDCINTKINIVAQNGIRRQVQLENLFSLSPNVGSDELAALKWAENRLRGFYAEKNLIISISDGYPGNIESATKYVQTLKRKGISACALAVNNSFEYLSKMYPNCIECNSPEDISRELIKVVKRALRLT